ncbi:YifB family Mg chelatase-like AAA ATPase [Persicirhabdus sediminis]|uniref:YifB family Mg chelatase-like AAA ATPase n=1 Tax=Persicirhabdus sediminis TaxID=454144 RepID=A0A8J7SH58_9BACT|nr:YifB family Mg chelatase-like AAA ATPase [Persicirhabdus sediminis]MBK1789614.1 YifB family Mg chelatase-like AAA ATPase [Persicirhabdus sediminis]
MTVRLFSSTLFGLDAVEVEVEVNASGSEKPKIFTVGLPDAAVRESSQRVTAALKNSGLGWDDGTITINLAPADLRKEGPRFDLPIALAMAQTSSGQDTIRHPERYCIAGELALDGKVRPVKGVLAMALQARKSGRLRLIVAVENAAEAAVVEGIEVYPVENLSDAWNFITGQISMAPYDLDREKLFHQKRSYNVDLNDVKGQAEVKRALEITAAGAHNLLMVGPPGTGKSMIAKRLPTILPDLSEEEAIESTKIHSIAGRLAQNEALLATRAFRAPHHTISDAGLLGGGSNPGPGEVSLAHHGVLFLDELPEFRRQTLEVMRQPLEDGYVTISRASASHTFPCNYILVAAMNPCPCGYYGDRKRQCRCNPMQIENYRRRISGPLLDRIDLHVEVPLIDYQELHNGCSGEPSEEIKTRVENARLTQLARFHQSPEIKNNASMSSKLMRTHCKIDDASSQLLEQAMNQLNFSARAHDRILKVARTIADLEQCQDIAEHHLLEAIQYRTLDRKMMM